MLQKDNKINWMYYHFLTQHPMKKKVTSYRMQSFHIERLVYDLLSGITLGEKKLEFICLSTFKPLVYPPTENTISHFLPPYQTQEMCMRETCTSNFRENWCIVRPLLSVSRFEIRKFCSFWQLPIYPDASNQKVKFLRNRVRKQVLPAVKFFFNSQIENIFLQFADIIEAEDQGMDQIANEFFTNNSLFWLYYQFLAKRYDELSFVQSLFEGALQRTQSPYFGQGVPSDKLCKGQEDCPLQTRGLRPKEEEDVKKLINLPSKNKILKLLNHQKVTLLIVRKSLLLQRDLRYFQRHVPFLYTFISKKKENLLTCYHVGFNEVSKLCFTKPITHFLLAPRSYEVSKSFNKKGVINEIACDGRFWEQIKMDLILHYFMEKNQKLKFQSSFQKTHVDLIGIPITSISLVKSSLIKIHKNTIKKLLFDKWVCKALQTHHYWFVTKYRTGKTFFLFNLPCPLQSTLGQALHKQAVFYPVGFKKVSEPRHYILYKPITLSTFLHLLPSYKKLVFCKAYPKELLVRRTSFASEGTITPLYKKYSNKKFSFYFLENLRFLQKQLRLVSLLPGNCTNFASRLRFLSIFKPWEVHSVGTNFKKRIKRKTFIKLSTYLLKRKVHLSGDNSVKLSKKQKLYQVLTSTINLKCSTIMSVSPICCRGHKKKSLVLPILQIQGKQFSTLTTQRSNLKDSQYGPKSILLLKKEDELSAVQSASESFGRALLPKEKKLIDFTLPILFFPRFSMSIKPSFWISNERICTFNNTTTNSVNAIFQSIDYVSNKSTIECIHLQESMSNMAFLGSKAIPDITFSKQLDASNTNRKNSCKFPYETSFVRVIGCAKPISDTLLNPVLLRKKRQQVACAGKLLLKAQRISDYNVFTSKSIDYANSEAWELKKNPLQLTSSDNEIENIFISNFLISFKKLELKKKNIYWPIIISFLPKSFQRRVAKIVLLNQNKKNIRYSQIEDFLTVKKKLH